MPKMTIKIAKDTLGFPSIVDIDKSGKKLKITTDSGVGFTIEGRRGTLPDFMEAYSVVLPRISHQKEADVIQGEDFTEVSSVGAGYKLSKVLGVQLSESKTVNRVIATLKSEDAAITAGIKVTYQAEGGAETTLIEDSTNSTVYLIYSANIAPDLFEFITFRVYLFGAGAFSGYNAQFTTIGDKLAIVGQMF